MIKRGVLVLILDGKLDATNEGFAPDATCEMETDGYGYVPVNFNWHYDQVIGTAHLLKAGPRVYADIKLNMPAIKKNLDALKALKKCALYPCIGGYMLKARPLEDTVFPRIIEHFQISNIGLCTDKNADHRIEPITFTED